MPIIQVSMFSGRTREKKRDITKALTEAFVHATGGKPESVHVIIRDVEKEDWGVGGVLRSDIHPDDKSDSSESGR